MGEESHLYIKVPHPDKVRKDLLYVKRFIYFRIHDALEELEKFKKIDELLDKIAEKIGEVNALLDELYSKLPGEEELKKFENLFKKKSKKPTSDKPKSQKSKEEKKPLDNKEEIIEELNELKYIEEELRRIEEELRKL